MVFQEGVNESIFMTQQERVAKHFSQYDDPQLKYNKKAELLGTIKKSGVDMYVVKSKMVGKLQDISCEIFISVTNRIRS